MTFFVEVTVEYMVDEREMQASQYPIERAIQMVKHDLYSNHRDAKDAEVLSATKTESDGPRTLVEMEVNSPDDVPFETLFERATIIP